MRSVTYPGQINPKPGINNSWSMNPQNSIHCNPDGQLLNVQDANLKERVTDHGASTAQGERIMSHVRAKCTMHQPYLSVTHATDQRADDNIKTDI